MKKLEDQELWELMSSLTELAEPVGNIVSDEAFWEKFVECTRKAAIIRRQDTMHFLIKAYSDLAPYLLGDEHRKDTIRILSVVEGKPFDKLMHANGVEVMRDLGKVWKEKLEPFFTKSVRSVAKG